MFIFIKQFITNKIARNSWIGLIDQGGNGLLWLLILSVVSKEIGVFSFGQCVLAITIAEMFGILSDFGISYMSIRIIATDKANASANLINLFALKLLLIPIAFIIVGLFTVISYNEEFFYLVCIACLAYAFKTTRVFICSLFNGYERMDHTAASNYIHMVTTGIVVYLFINLDVRNADILLWAVVSGGVVSTVFTIIVANRYYRIHWAAPNTSNIKQKFTDAIPFGFFFVGAFLYFSLDTFMLSIFKGEKDVGIYQVAFRFIMGFELIPNVISMALYPAVSRSLMEEPNCAQRLLKKSLIYILLFTVPIGVLLMLFSKKIIMIFFGPSYEAAIVVLQILSLMIPLRAVAHILGMGLTSIGYQNERLKAVYLAAVGNFALNAILIPRYSYFGASITTVFTAMLLSAIYYYSLMSKLKGLGIGATDQEVNI